MSDFATYIATERDRIISEMARIDGNITELTHQRGALERELVAVGAYENAKSGKAAAASNGARRARRGSRREELVKLVRDAGGLTRGELINRLGVKGDKSGEMSISNALTALTKANQLARDPQMPSRYVYQNAA